MSRYPSATWKPIANRSSKALQKDLLSIHTCVGPGLGTWNYFNTGAGGRGVYSHIIVCGVWGSDAGKNVDGLALQMQETNLRAAANLDGNWHIISVETADNAARPIAPWTAAQQTTLVNIMLDAHRLDGIPLVLVPDSKPGRRGISYHRLGCNPYRVPGGELWSEAYGKDCPTQARINQIPGLIARARAIVNGTPQEDDLDATQDHKLTETHDWTGQIGLRVPTDNPEQMRQLGGRTLYLQAMLAQVLHNAGTPVEYRPDGNYPDPVDPPTQTPAG